MTPCGGWYPALPGCTQLYPVVHQGLCKASSNFFPINISKKRRSVRVEPDLTIDDLDLLRSKTLTKRNLLGVTNGFGDFLGLASPFTVRFKVLMRDLFLLEEPVTWDQEVPAGVKDQWVGLITEALQDEDSYWSTSTSVNIGSKQRKVSELH
jgi:hypothetical protein